MQATPCDFSQRMKTICHYRILGKLGQGGMGEVFLATDEHQRRKVAIKVLKRDVTRNPQAVRRFRREAHLASLVKHPNVCTVLEIGQDLGGRMFIVMELLEGQTLQQRVAAGSLDPATLIELGIQLAAALEATHARGIVHRDIKPTNVFVTLSGQVKLLDFGLARLAVGADNDDTLSYITVSGGACGTRGYMSPEQALGRPIDARTDLFSLGVVLYEAATGRRPFSGPSSGAVLDAILHRQPKRIRVLNRDIPKELECIIFNLLEKWPARRYPTANSLLADLRRLFYAEMDQSCSDLSLLVRSWARAVLKEKLDDGFVL